MRVVVQERRALLREGLATLLRSGEAAETVRTVADDVECLAVARSWPVDTAVIELHPPDWDVVRLVRQLRRVHPEIRIAALHRGRRSDHALVAETLAPDAMVSYRASAAALRDAVHPRTSERSEPAADRRTAAAVGALSARELEVLGHLAAGLTTGESAQLLGIEPKTVEGHKGRLFAKLGVRNQAHAVAIAHRMGIYGHV